MASTRSPIGAGIYSPVEAASLVRASARAVRRWTFGPRPSFRNSAPETGERCLSFLDLVRVLAIRSLRVEPYKLSLPKIKACVDFLEREVKIDDPLARNIRLGRFSGRLLAWVGDRWIGAERGDFGQEHVTPIVQPYVEHITFGGPGGVASRWTFMQGSGASIEVDPTIRLGEPVLQPYGLSAREVAISVRAEGGIDRAALLHGVTPGAASLAIDFLDSIERPAA